MLPSRLCASNPGRSRSLTGHPTPPGPSRTPKWLRNGRSGILHKDRVELRHRRPTGREVDLAHVQGRANAHIVPVVRVAAPVRELPARVRVGADVDERVRIPPYSTKQYDWAQVTGVDRLRANLAAGDADADVILTGAGLSHGRTQPPPATSRRRPARAVEKQLVDHVDFLLLGAARRRAPLLMRPQHAPSRPPLPEHPGPRGCQSLG